MGKRPNFTKAPWVRGSCDSWIIWAAKFNSTNWKEGNGPESVVVATISSPAWARVECAPEIQKAWLAESDANAALIYAAPDLYDFIATIENDDGAIPDWLWAKREALLAKARGETP